MRNLDGPRRAARLGKADSLVVILHGYGANGDDLFPLASVWAERLGTTAFVAPNAPEQLPYAGMGGYQWFPLTLRDPEEYIHGSRTAAPILDAFLDAELARLNLPASRLAIVGFSQGTMMALHVGLRRKIQPAAIVGFSGVIAGAQHLPAEITCRPPVMLIHGADDEVIPVGALELTREAVAACGVDVEWHVREGLGHRIDDESQTMAGSFLAQQLGSSRSIA